MSYQWKPGMKAVCVKSDTAGETYEGCIYMVKQVGACRCGWVLLDLGFLIPPRWTGSYCECGFSNPVEVISWQRAYRFRPLDELEATMDRLEKEGCPTSLPQPELA